MRVVEAVRVVEPGEATVTFKDKTVPVLVPSVQHHGGQTIVMCDGEPVLLLDKLDDKAMADLRRAARAYPIPSSVVRGQGFRNKARVFGFLGGNPVMKRASCRACSGADDAPGPHAALCDLAGPLADMLMRGLPQQWAANQVAVDGVLPEWRLPGGLWTSGVLNETSSLPYHRDRNNYDAWSAMPVVRRGTIGGHLHFPELEVDGEPLVTACADGDVVFFNGQAWYHGVTPITRRSRDGYRFSAVYYPVAKMGNCLSRADETRRGNLRRTTNERDLIARQRGNGMMETK